MPTISQTRMHCLTSAARSRERVLKRCVDLRLATTAQPKQARQPDAQRRHRSRLRHHILTENDPHKGFLIARRQVRPYAGVRSGQGAIALGHSRAWNSCASYQRTPEVVGVRVGDPRVDSCLRGRSRIGPLSLRVDIGDLPADCVGGNRCPVHSVGAGVAAHAPSDGEAIAAAM